MRLGIFFFLIFVTASNLYSDRLDSLRKILSSPVHDSLKFDAMIKLAGYYDNIKSDSVLYYYDKINSEGEKYLNSAGIKDRRFKYLVMKYMTVSLNGQGAKFVSLGRYPESQEKLLRAARIVALILKEYNKEYRSESMKQLAYIYNNLGNSYDYQANYKNAADYYTKALKIFNLIKMDTTAVDPEAVKSGEAITCFNLAFVMESNKNPEKGAEYSRQARKMFIELSVSENKKYRLTGIIGTVNSSNSLGAYYLTKEMYDSAFFYHGYAKNLLDSINKITDNHFIYEYAHTLTSIGIVHKRKKEYDKAAELYIEGLKIREEIGDFRSISVSLNNLSALYHELGDYHRALDYAHKSWENAVKACTPKQKAIAAEGIAGAYEELGNSQEALKWYKTYKEIRDSLVSEENVRTTSELEAKYQSDKKDIDLKLMKNQKELDDLKLKKQRDDLNIARLRLYFLIIMIFMILILSFLLYFSLRQRHRKILDAKLLEEEKLRLITVIETQEIERTRIARDLHDGIGQMLSAASMNFSLIGDKIKTGQESGSNFENSLKIINDCCNELRVISHQMMPRSLREEGLVIAIQELLNRLFKNTKIKISFETYGIEGRLPDNIENGIFRIIQELTANIIKHSKAEIVTIQILKADSHLVLVVEDDGIGIKEKASGSGIGWKNINARVSAMNGSCFIENGKEKGVTVTVKIPFINS